jgi:hypothetical protein
LLLYGSCSSVLYSSSLHSYLWHLQTCKSPWTGTGGFRVWVLLISHAQELCYLCWWFHCRFCNGLVVGCGSGVRYIGRVVSFCSSSDVLTCLDIAGNIPALGPMISFKRFPPRIMMMMTVKDLMISPFRGDTGSSQRRVVLFQKN